MAELRLKVMLTRLLRLLSVIGPFVLSGILMIWTLILFRSIPLPFGDHGMFVSVAERLKAGDTLYADVYENKDPLFHYSLAIARSISPFGDWALEAVWLAAAAAASVSIARSVGLSTRRGAFVGLIIAPIILTGSSYVPGSSHLPSVALTLVAIALYLRSHLFAVGLILGSLLLFKLVAFPAAFAAVAVLLLVPRDRKRILNFLGGLGLAVFALIAIIAMRGEFKPYLQSLTETIEYADNQSNIGLISRVVGHVEPVFAGGNLSSAVVTLALLAIGVAAVRDLGKGRLGLNPAQKTLTAAIVMLIVNFAVIAFTGLWSHHFQIFVSQLIIIFIVFVKYLVFDPLRLNALTVAGALLLGYAVAGSPALTGWVDSLLFARANIWEQTQIPAETKALIEAGSPSTFARLGTGNDRGFARGLGQWSLECRYFGQSPLSSRYVLNETLDCFPNANFIIVDSDFREYEGAESWNEFVRASESQIAATFQCSSVGKSRICARKMGP